jgi:hypothetical protein
MSQDAITVGAVDAGNTAGNDNGTALQNEEYSGSGEGTELWFNYDGSDVTGAPLEYDPVALSGVDDIATTVTDIPHALGTSFATPSVAAVAADMLSADGDLLPMEIETILEQTAYAFGDSDIAGAGLVQAAQAVSAALAAIAWTGAAGDWYTGAGWTSASGSDPSAAADALILSGTVSVTSGDQGIDLAALGLNTSGILDIADPGQTQTVISSVVVDGAGKLNIDSAGLAV